MKCSCFIIRSHYIRITNVQTPQSLQRDNIQNSLMNDVVACTASVSIGFFCIACVAGGFVWKCVREFRAARLRGFATRSRACSQQNRQRRLFLRESWSKSTNWDCLAQPSRSQEAENSSHAEITPLWKRLLDRLCGRVLYS